MKDLFMKDPFQDLLIIVPGAKYVHSDISVFQKIILGIYRLVNVHKPVYFNYAKNWERKLISKTKTIWLHWSRGISYFSRKLAVKRLIRLINKHSDCRIKLIGISIGCEIIIEALEQDPRLSLETIVFVCPAFKNNPLLYSESKIVNIYSEKDLLSKLGTFLFSNSLSLRFFGGKKLHGPKISNIMLPEMTHDEFCMDEKIKAGAFKGKSITRLVLESLKDSF